MEYLDRGRRSADLDFALRQLIRHAVPVTIKLDVIVDVDPGCFPLAVAVALAWQRLESGPVHRFKQRLTRAFLFAERPLIETAQQARDGFVDLA